MNRLGKNREPESITAPPQSSDEEEEDYQQQRHNSSHDSDSDNNDSRYKDIKPTIFSSSQKGGPSSSAGSKRSSEDITPEARNHLTNAFGFTKIQKRTITKRTTTYSDKSSQPRPSQRRASQKPGPKPSVSQLENDSGKSFRHFKTSPSPEGIRSPPAKRFVKPENISPEKAEPSKAFIKPSSLSDSSPSRDTKKPIFRRGSLSSDDSLSRSKSKKLGLEESNAAVEAKPALRPGRIKDSKRSKNRKRKSLHEPGVDEFSQRPAFKLHALDDIDDLDDSDDVVFDVFGSKDSDDEAGDVSIQSPLATTARCPMCHEVVDPELLAKHSDHGRMNIKKQAAFCRLHKRRAALDSGARKGYPKVNWERLDTRLDTYHGLLKEILEGTRKSHYHEVLRENVEAGKNRTLLKTDDSLTPGYYGPHGLRVMTEYILRTLSSVIRKRAVEDRLVSARGYTGYVQAVLVPELTVRLIMEDMDIAEEKARDIMLESIDVGELLYEDTGDVIAGVSDEEEI
ncbi:RTC4-like domain-containing protein, partial [Daldinia vernicosa]|uniref:RTC4-like domain-containing protein n=1 Tax=Daldinia vernicosa TaxID=114800 RepID=UPI002007FCD4